MKVTVVECAAFGPIEDLRVVERDPQPLGPGQVRLAVSASGVNFVDGLLVEGRYQIKPPLPFVPGGEIVGRITELSDGVERSSPSVIQYSSNLGFGGFASEVACRRRLVAIRESLTDGQAATFMQSYMTGLVRAAATSPTRRHGDTMLVLGAGSGVGLAAVDIGAALGLRVIAAASTPEKRALAESRGAHDDHRQLDARRRRHQGRRQSVCCHLRRPCRSRRLDLIYDPVGGEVGRGRAAALGEDGQYIVIGFVAGIPQAAANQVLLRNRRVDRCRLGRMGGTYTRTTPIGRCSPRSSSGSVRAICDPVEPVSYPLHDAARACVTWPTARWPARSRSFAEYLNAVTNRWWRSRSDLADCPPTWWS